MLDLMIPREDGPTNFRAFRHRFAHIPILLCTGLLQPDMANTLGGEAVEILRKPFRMNELWERVARALEASDRRE